MRKLFIYCILFCVLCFVSQIFASKPFVILIPSYNNEKVCRWNILSAIHQKYQNFRVIYIDDCSSDKTLSIVKKTIKEKKDKVTIIENKERKKAMFNIYNAIINYIKDEEIVVMLDGDDALADDSVLSYLNRIYTNEDIWLTYGQFKTLHTNYIGFCRPYPTEVVLSNSFRKYQYVPSHLRTFYAWLFKKIKIEDLQIHGKFFEMSCDIAMMMPMLEMARCHFQFVPKVLYIYNDSNPINDHKVSRDLQYSIDQYIRNVLTPYSPILSSFMRISSP